jgi:hypothetical protein
MLKETGVVSRALRCAVLGGAVLGGGALGCGGNASTTQGAASLMWSIFDASTGLPASCAAVGASGVTLHATPEAGNGGAISLTLPCARGGSAGELAAGTYRILPQLVAVDGGVLSNAPEQSATVVVGQTTALAPAVFAASTSASTRSGFLAASLSIGPAGVPNCQGGAGMTGVALVLAHGDGRCAPARLVRSRGGFLIGTYDANNCISPAVASCVEADEVVTVGDLEPGPYILRVRGKKGGLECWTADETFTVVPGTPLVHMFALTASSSPGC